MDNNNIDSSFPILSQEYNGKKLVYLDSAATTQKPLQVIDAISNYYKTINANVHRSVHNLGAYSTRAMEDIRDITKTFINADDRVEIIFTKGTTESINLVAQSLSKTLINKGDTVVVSAMEHHSNFVPWQQICIEKNANFKVVDIDAQGGLDINTLDDILEHDSSVKILALTHISNVIGTIIPVKEIIEKAHKKGILVLIDGAQAIAHLKVDVQDLDCDFYTFSGHKMYAPMGIGVLYGKKHLLEMMPPYQYGGEMIESVAIEHTTFNELPYKFEAGTPNVEGIVGLGEAIRFMNSNNWMFGYEDELMRYAVEKLSALDFIEIYGQRKDVSILPYSPQHDVRKGVISFNIKGQHHYDVGTLLNQLNIAVRTGHHCAEPLMHALNIEGTIRASFAVYNNTDDVDKLIAGLQQVHTMLVSS